MPRLNVVRKLSFASAILMLAPSTNAIAHAEAGLHADFFHGLAHPFAGLDHVLVMLGVGLLAWIMGKARWQLPLAFVLIMAGGACAASFLSLFPWVESAIAASVIGVGILIMRGKTLSFALALPLIAIFALTHGYSHGAEMPILGSGLAYGAGFVLATASLHAMGLLVGAGLTQLGAIEVSRATGLGMAVLGFALLLGTLP